MKNTTKKFIDFLVAIVMTSAVATMVVCLLTFFNYPKESEARITVSDQFYSERIASSTAFIPEQIEIPAIGVETSVEQVGISNKGNVMSPASFKTVGWYKYGVLPGERGVAILVGHVDNALGLAGVFKDLPDLNPGNDIYLYDEENRRLRFKVKEKAIYPYDLSFSKVVEPNDKRQIILITCFGEWNQQEKTYDNRLVVLAELVVGDYINSSSNVEN